LEEWVWHHLESDDVKNPLRQLPAEVAITIDPFDIWWIPETLLYQSDAVQFARLLHSIISLSKFNEDQTDLIAEHMCVSDKTVENIMDRVEVSYGRIVQSCQDQYPNEQDEATGG
jgi:hypothetical protein